MRPDDLPSISELAQRKEHGTRLRYMGGCRCIPCRAANSRYETERAAARKAGDWNGLVSAAKARKHLAKLSQAGIGRRSVAAACDISLTVICEIKSGKKKQIRARTSRKILSVTREAIQDGTLIKGDRTWKLINRLLSEGFSKAELARRLGYKTPAIQIKPCRITARTARRVERFYRKIMAGA
jgi:hypothetical protein